MTTVTAVSSAERRKRLKLKRIVVSEHNYLVLKKLGCAGDSFNDVISKLLRIYWNYQEKQQEQPQQQKQQQESDDANSGNSTDIGFLFPPSFSEILDEQKKKQQTAGLLRLLNERKSSKNNQTIK